MRDVEVRVELSARSALNTVVWPEMLCAVRGLDGVGERLEMMGAGKGDVSAGVPVLRKDDVLEPFRESIDPGDDSIAVGHR